ncbi:5-formyltetrahydrofolate cyclo-ligase [Nocardia caishijiensis]|uniref:5-formyltetrahydrofolate cyclo-ligase n=1 Tax=Nocardia caishijiensis TaxID=184756 RepID=A0ABQ6YT41_9NOCA|nr:5-formyltetrahydrofolate cyclo-ligase [Nocardia caishijiensis]KAF0848735.1 5-formyltetrahydrofolate cyclo-ligase [Nocardia caishijiensis]
MPGERTKYAWRREILATRAALGPAEHAREASALAAAAALLAGADEVVCAYVPTRGEPGDLRMLDALRERGATVLLPVTGAPGPLSWARYAGADSLRRARYGLLEPTTETLPPATVADAATILVPALAVDRRGVRLGRGAGYYDRTLGAADADARLIAVVRDAELVAELPEEPHDRRMGWALTPGAGLGELGDSPARAAE